MSWKTTAGAIGLLIAGSVALDNPDSTNDKIDNTGSVVGNLLQEAGNVANSGVGSLQGVGQGSGAAPAPQATTPTTAPPAGSGRP